MAFDAGSIEASLTLDRTEFNTGLDQAKADAREFANGRYTTTVGAETAAATAGIDETTRKLDELGDKHVDPTVGLDDATARAKLDELNLRLQAMQDKVALARVDADTTKARSKLIDVQSALDGFASDTYDPNINLGRIEALNKDLDGLDQRLGKVNSDMEKTGGASNGATQAMGPAGLLGAVASLTPALLTVGAVGAGALIGIAGAAANGAVGLGALALAAKPVLTSINTAAAAQVSYNNAVAAAGPNSTRARSALIAMTEAYQQLTPAEAVAASGMADFKNQYQTWTQSFDPYILPLFSNGLGLVRTVMGQLTPVIQGSATALTGLEVQARSALAGPYWSSFSTFIAGQASTSITTFGHLLGGTVTLLSGLDRAFAPLIADVEAGLNRMATAESRFGMSATGSTGITHFIDYVQQNGPAVGHVLGEIVTTLVQVSSDLAGLGPSYLTILTAVGDVVSTIASVDPGLIQLAGVLLTVNQLMGPLGGLKAIFNIGSGIDAAILKVQGLTAGMRGVATVAPAVAAGEEEIAVGAKSIGASIDSMLPVVGIAAIAITALISLFDHTSQTAKTAGDNFTQGFVNQISQGTTSVSQQEAALQREIDKLTAFNQSVLTTTPIYGRFNLVIGQATTVMAGSQAQYDKNQVSISGLKTKLDELRNSTQGQLAAQQAATGVMTSALTPAQQLTYSQQQLAQVSETVTQDVTGLTTALVELNGGFPTVDEGNITVEQNLKNLSTSLGTNKTSFDETTTAGLANKSALDTLVASINTQITTMAKQHDSQAAINAVVAGYMTQIESTASAAGIAQPVIDGYTKALGLTPKTVDTVFQQTGLDVAMQKQHALQAQVDLLQNKTVTLTVNYASGGSAYNTTGNAGGIGAKNPGGAAMGAVIRAATGTVMPMAAVAAGMVTNTPTYLVGEDGSGHDEYVIPTNPAHHGSAVALAGQLLPRIGMKATPMATGGIMDVKTIMLDYGGGAIPSVSGWYGSESSASAAGSAIPAPPPPALASGPVGTSYAANAALGQQLAASMYGWTGAEWTALNAVVMHESGWSPTAQNPTSTAYGIGQNINGPAGYGSYGTSVQGQIEWTLNYIKGRYGDPIGAEHHEQAYNWYETGGILGKIPWGSYDTGGWLPEGLSIAHNGTGAPERIPGPSAPGATVQINGAVINHPVDLDMLLNRASFALTAAGIG